MKIHQSKNIKKSLFLSVAVILLLGTVGVAIAYHYKVGIFSSDIRNGVDYGKPTEEEKKTGDAIKKQSLDQTKTSSGSDPALTPQPIEGSDKKSVNMEITAVNQNEPNLQIRTLIQTVTTTGACTLSMEGPQGITYTAEVDVQSLASSSSCKGFDIPLNQLTSGNWSITVNFNNNEISASTTKEIEVK